jgi:hypothetical protein
MIYPILSAGQSPPLPQQPAAPLLPPYPARDDAAGWADWWHRWEYLGRLAARLDPAGALYEATYRGDHTLPDCPESPPERRDAP